MYIRNPGPPPPHTHAHTPGHLLPLYAFGRVFIRVCVHSKTVKISFMGVQCRPAVLLLPARSTQVLGPPLVISVKPDMYIIKGLLTTPSIANLFGNFSPGLLCPIPVFVGLVFSVVEEWVRLKQIYKVLSTGTSPLKGLHLVLTSPFHFLPVYHSPPPHPCNLIG